MLHPFAAEQPLDLQAALQRRDAERLVQQVGGLLLELDGGGARGVLAQRLQRAAVEEEQRRAGGGHRAVDGDVPGEQRLARVDVEVLKLDLLAAGREAEARAAVVDQALDIRVDRAGLVVDDVAARDREAGDAGRGDRRPADGAGRDLQRVRAFTKPASSATFVDEPVRESI